MLILASSSPRRHEILTAAGIPHVIQPADIDEALHANESPAQYVLRLAETKARALPIQPGNITLGADTTVALDNEIFGKPTNRADAIRMLRRLSARTHTVYTGICLLSQQKCIKEVATTRVTFLEWEEAEIQEYTQGEPFDKAGGYGIQGAASKFIAGIEGCYYNVVGLPVSLVYRLLKSF